MARVEKPPPTPSAQALAHMQHLRTLVQQGMPIEQASAEVGVDPIIGTLWARLPEDLFSPPSPPTPPARLPAERTIRYVTVTGPSGLKKVVRVDGRPLCAEPPEQATRAIRERREAAEARWQVAVRQREK